MITQNQLKVSGNNLAKNWAVCNTSSILDEKVRNAIIGRNSKETSNK